MANGNFTFEQHRCSVYQLVCLKLFYLHFFHASFPEAVFAESMRKKVNLYWLTSFWHPGFYPVSFEVAADPGWQALSGDLEVVRKAHLDSAEEFEEAGFKILKPFVDAALPRTYIDISWLSGYQCGSLRYNENEDGSPCDTVEFHLANAIRPNSCLDEWDYMRMCFAELIRQSRAKYHCRKLTFHSWLNSCSRWLAFFPKSYQQSLSAEETEVQWHLGYWGQFIKADGLFNERNGSFLRTHKRFPFYQRRGTCSCDELAEHLHI